MTVSVKTNRAAPLLKYPGGKEKELKFILPAIPEGTHQYFEPFVGGGAVYLALEADRYYINDKSSELMGLYRMAASQDPDFFHAIEAMDSCFRYLSDLADRYRDELIRLYTNCRTTDTFAEHVFFPVRIFLYTIQDSLDDSLLFRSLPDSFYLREEAFWTQAVDFCHAKIARMLTLEKSKGLLSDDDIVSNLEGCLKSAFYMQMRERYNRRLDLQLSYGEQIALYVFIREYCYSSMFRYNKKGDFNVPYGGISYNRKPLTGKIQAMKSPDLLAQLSRTLIAEEDFIDFLERYTPGEDDFVFLDPPYDTDFSSYDGSEFGKTDHMRLAEWLIHSCKGYFMLVIKNTDLIRELYPEGTMTESGRPLQVYRFDTKYLVSFKDRNNRVAEHLMITNYPVLTDACFLDGMQNML